MTTYTEKKFKGLLLKRQLPKGSITVNGSLGLGNCTGLKALPDNLTVNGYLTNCTGLKALPDNLTVNGYLNLTNCTGLTALPENLTVNGSLDLDGCKGFTALPNNLTVKGSLSLEGCTGLKSFYKVKVQGTIFFDDSLISRIPNEELIKHLGMSPEIDALIARRFKEGP